MRRILKAIFFIPLLLFIVSSCSQKQQAESIVKSFIKSNLKADKYSVKVLKVDSTLYITDSMINVMKLSAKKNELFKGDIKYEEALKSKLHFYARAEIFIKKDTFRQTFYLDSAMTKVIAFK